MSLKRNVNEMVKKRLSEKGNRRNNAIDHTGLHKRPQMEGIVDYLANGQEHVRFPDREAKFVRNHPFMTQLDFFDMQEEQQRAWEEQKREQEAKQVATETKTSAAVVKAGQNNAGTQYRGVSGEEWDNSLKHAFRVWDAESDTMTTEDLNKKEANTQTSDTNLTVSLGLLPLVCLLSLGSVIFFGNHPRLLSQTSPMNL